MSVTEKFKASWRTLAHKDEPDEKERTEFDHAVAESLEEALDRVLDDRLGASSADQRAARTERLLNRLEGDPQP